jgi:hypothetical protein
LDEPAANRATCSSSPPDEPPTIAVTMRFPHIADRNVLCKALQDFTNEQL